MLELYGSGSPNVFKVIFALSELELPYRFHEIDVTSRQQYSAEFRALNPNSKVPVLVDTQGLDGQPHTVFESGAILIYLAEKTNRLLGENAQERSQVIQWLLLQVASIGPIFGQALHFLYIAGISDDYPKRRYLNEANRLYDVLDDRLSAVPWLAGNSFSIVDIATYPWVGRYWKTLGIDVAKRPAVERWIRSVEARPGWQRVEVKCKALFKAGLEKQSQADPADLDVFFGRVPAFPDSGTDKIA